MMKLSICQCPIHKYWSVSIDDESGGTRITPSKCCGRWDVVKAFKLSKQEWLDIRDLAENAAEDTP